MQNKELSRTMLLFGEKKLVLGQFETFLRLQSFLWNAAFCDFEVKILTISIKYAFSLQNSDAEQKLQSDNAFVLVKKACFSPILDIFAFTSPFCEMQRFVTLKRKYSLFQ